MTPSDERNDRAPALLSICTDASLAESRDAGATVAHEPPPADRAMPERDATTTRPDGLGEGGWSSNLELRHLRAFVTLVEQGSLTRAARAMGIAQSTVSEALAALERALGTPAVSRRRGGHGITLTPAGQALLPFARRMLATLAEAHAAVAEATHEALASVEIIANESVTSYLLPSALAVLRSRWPKTRFAVAVATCPVVRAGVESARYDVGIWLQEPTRAGDTVASLASHRVVIDEVPLTIFAQSAHPLLAGRATGRTRSAAPIARDAVLPFPIYLSDAAGDFHDLIAAYFAADGLGAPRFEATGSIEGVKHNVAADRNALGVLPSYALATELRAGTFRALSLRPLLPHVRLDATTVAGRPLHPAVEELLAELARSNARAAIPRAI
jgi:molybdate transport repressor ModE-like protein